MVLLVLIPVVKFFFECERANIILHCHVPIFCGVHKVGHFDQRVGALRAVLGDLKWA